MPGIWLRERNSDMQFDFGCNKVVITDGSTWSETIYSIAQDIFDEAGLDTESDAFEDFRYDVLEGVMIDVIQDALNEAANDDRLKLDNFRDFFDRMRG